MILNESSRCPRLQTAQQLPAQLPVLTGPAIPVPLSVTKLPHQLGCSLQIQDCMCAADLWSVFEEMGPLIELKGPLASM